MLVMNLELVSQIAGIGSFLIALLSLVGIAVTIKKVSNLNNKSNINVFGDVVGDINASNQVQVNSEKQNGSK